MSTIFSKIIGKEIPADIVYEDELVLAFRDIAPQAPVHILIVTKKEIATVNDVTSKDEAALGRLFTVAAKIARDEGIADDGYRLIVNCNAHGGQEGIPSAYAHLGRPQPGTDARENLREASCAGLAVGLRAFFGGFWRQIGGAVFDRFG